MEQQQLQKNHLVEKDIDTVACLSVDHMSHFFQTFYCVYYIASSGHRSYDVARGARRAHFVAVLSVYFKKMSPLIEKRHISKNLMNLF